MGCFIYFFFWCIGLRSQAKALYWSNYFARHILLFFFLLSSFPLFLSQIYTFAIPVFAWCVLWHLFKNSRYNKDDKSWIWSVTTIVQRPVHGSQISCLWYHCNSWIYEIKCWMYNYKASIFIQAWMPHVYLLT